MANVQERGKKPVKTILDEDQCDDGVSSPSADKENEAEASYVKTNLDEGQYADMVGGTSADKNNGSGVCDDKTKKSLNEKSDTVTGGCFDKLHSMNSPSLKSEFGDDIPVKSVTWCEKLDVIGQPSVKEQGLDKERWTGL